MQVRVSLLVVFTLVCSQKLVSQTADEINDKTMDMISFSSMEMTSTLKIIDSKGRERIRKMITTSDKFNGINKTLMRFTSPSDISGTAMLVFDYDKKDDDMWIYLPALRKTRRIVSSEKGKSFMGSEFSNADMSRPNEEDFTHKILAEETYMNQACWKLESQCKNEDIEDMYGYSRKAAWIGKKNYLCYKIEYYDYNDELLKVQTLDNYKKQPNGKYFAYHMEMKNLQNGRSSVLIVDNFNLGSNYPESHYSSAMLSK